MVKTISTRNLLRQAVSLCLCAGAAGAQANPGSATVVSGSATITQSGSTLTVANSPNTIINWHDFSIGVGETTQFIQQSAASAVLNRVTGGDPSQILGTLQSNGRVFLINPAGIMFGAGATVNVAGLVASTLNISDADFLSGKHAYNANIANPGKVSNAGEIRTPTGGFVYLIGAQVENSGMITTPSGEAVLAAGHSVELVDSTDPSLRVTVSAHSQDINLSQMMVDNDGDIFAVLNSGRISANTVTQDATGKIYFKSAGNIETTSGSVAEAAGTSTLDGGHIQAFAGLNGDYSGFFDISGRNGGFLETSAAYLTFGRMDFDLHALSTGGVGGSWLLDPFDFVIGNSEATLISNAINGGALNITIDTAAATATGAAVNGTSGVGTITINADISGSNSDNTTINLISHSDITLNGKISGSNLDVNIDAGQNGNNTASVIFGSGGGIDIGGAADVKAYGGGNITMNSAALIKANSVTLNTVGGDITAYVSTATLDAGSITNNAPNTSTVSIYDDAAITTASVAVSSICTVCVTLITTPSGSANLTLSANPNVSSSIDMLAASNQLTFAQSSTTLQGVDITSNGNLTVTANDLDLTFALVPVGGGLFTQNPSLVILDSASGQLTVNANNLTVTNSNLNASSLCSGCDLTVNAASLNLTGNGTQGRFLSSNNLTVNAGANSATLTQFMIDGGTVNWISGLLNLDSSSIFGSNSLTLTSGDLNLDSNGGAGSQIYGATTAIHATDITLNALSGLGADTDISITSDSLLINNVSSIFADGNLTIDNSGLLSMDSSLISAFGTTNNISTGTLTLGTDAVIEGSGDLNLTVTGDLTTLTASNAEINMNGDGLMNIGGALSLNDVLVSYGGGLTMTAGTVTLTDTTMNINGALDLQVASLSLDNFSVIQGNQGLTMDIIGAFSLDTSTIQGGQTSGGTAIQAASLDMNNAEIIAGSDLIVNTGTASLTNATVDANGSLDFSASSITMNSSKIGEASGMTPSIIHINSAGDIVLTGSEIVADNEVFITLYGKLYLNSGGSSRSLVGTLSDNTIYLYFPNLFFGGYFMDGSESLLVSAFNPSTGFFTGTNLTNTAILNTNLFITYAPNGPITGVISQNTTNTLATSPYVDAYGPQQTGPGDSSYTYGIIWDPTVGELGFSEVRECS